MKVILFLLDAFRYDYISKETTPFLWDCTKKGKYIKHIIPSAGFCERTEIFTGLKPNESGFFTAIGFDPEKSQYKTNYLLSLFGKIETLICRFDNKKLKPSVYFRKIIFKLLQKKFSSYKLKPYNIPFSFLKYFNLTEDEFEMNTKDFFATPSIFKFVEMKGGFSFLDAFTSLGMPSNGTDIDRINIALLAHQEMDYLFTPIYIGVIDAEGHKYGPKSGELKIELNKLDRVLMNSVDKFSEIDETIKFVFLGDHGMTEIRLKLDVESILLKEAKSLRLKKGKDYIYFLDSTILRVWFLTEKAQIKLELALRNNDILSKNGEIISDDIAEKYSIPISDRRYGDFAWWANSGVLIFPDFFHIKNPYNGMHGYKPKEKSTYGTCLVSGADIKNSYRDEMPLHEVNHLISELIEK